MAEHEGDVVVDAEGAPSSPRLTPREHAVAVAVGTGASNKSVARALHITVKTVEFHLGNVYRKLGLRSRAELAHVVGRGLLAAPPDPVAAASAATAAASAANHAGSLATAAGSSFVGRAELLDRIEADATPRTVLTLLGPGGAGKTRVALELARRTSRPVVFVDLARIESDDDVPLAFARSHAAGSAGADPAHLDDPGALVVVDNCEHVIAGAALLCERLAGSLPRSVIVATSRTPLRIPGERTVEVPPLAADAVEDPAVELFLDRCGSDVTIDPHEALELVRMLDGLPLAIELAAVQVRTFGVRQLRMLLDDSLWSLADRSHARPARHHTLADTVQWSLRLLRPEARAALARACAVPGPMSLDAMLAVIADARPRSRAAAASRIPELIDSCLVTVDLGGPEPRYRVLETIRAVCSAELREPDEVLDRLLAYCRETAARVADDRSGAGLARRVNDEQALHVLATRHALRTGRANDAMQLVYDLTLAWSTDLWSLSLDRLIDEVRDAVVEPSALRAEVCRRQARLALATGASERARHLLHLAEQDLLLIGARPQLGRVHVVLGSVLVEEGASRTEVERVFAGAVEDLGAAGDDFVFDSHVELAEARLRFGDVAGALDLVEPLRARPELHWYTSMLAAVVRAEALLVAGELDRASDAASEALAEADRVGDRPNVTHARGLLRWCALDGRSAASVFDEFAALCREPVALERVSSFDVRIGAALSAALVGDDVSARTYLAAFASSTPRSPFRTMLAAFCEDGAAALLGRDIGEGVGVRAPTARHDHHGARVASAATVRLIESVRPSAGDRARGAAGRDGDGVGLDVEVRGS